MGLPTQLKTARLALRPVAASDEAALVSAINHFEISKWLAVVPYPYTDADFQVFLTDIAQPGATFAMDDAQGFAGIISLQDGVLGYWLALRAQGRGYATEAGRALLAAHFSQSNEPVLSGYFLGNHRSARVLAKLGFLETGRDVKHNRAQDADLAHVIVAATPEAFGSTQRIASGAPQLPR